MGHRQFYRTAWRDQRPDLSLCYLPHLDYDLQRFGPDGDHLVDNLTQLDHCLGQLIDHASHEGCELIIVSEYGIEAVNQGIPINQALRRAGLLHVQRNQTGNSSIQRKVGCLPWPTINVRTSIVAMQLTNVRPSPCCKTSPVSIRGGKGTSGKTLV